jgi:hypothetical protein
MATFTMIHSRSEKDSGVFIAKSAFAPSITSTNEQNGEPVSRLPGKGCSWFAD